MSHPKQTEMDAKVSAIEEALREAEAFADEHGLSFTFTPAYGMGGTYVPAKAVDDSDWEESAGWQASSLSC